MCQCKTIILQFSTYSTFHKVAGSRFPGRSGFSLVLFHWNSTAVNGTVNLHGVRRAFSPAAVGFVKRAVNCTVLDLGLQKELPWNSPVTAINCKACSHLSVCDYEVVNV